MNEEEIKHLLHRETERLSSSNFNYTVLQKVAALKKTKSLPPARDLSLLVGCLVLAALSAVLAPWQGQAAPVTFLLVSLLLLLPVLLIAVYTIQQKTKTN